MKWFGRLIRKLVRLAVITTVLTALVFVLDAVLLPKEDSRPR